MAIDSFGPNPPDLMKNEQNPLIKFRQYFADLIKRNNGVDATLREIKVDELGDSEMVFFQKFIGFLKKMNNADADLSLINDQIAVFTKEIANCGYELFKNWMSNKLQPFALLKHQGDANQFSIENAKFIVNEILSQINIVESENQNLSEFKNYISQLKERFSSINGDIIGINVENLGDYELDFYKKVISFLKSLNANNCSLEFITNSCKELFKLNKGCADKQFGPWLSNEIMPLFHLNNSDTWAGEEEGNIKSLVECALANIDPENKF